MKNIHAQILGSLGGKAGKGKSKARSSEQARKAVNVRWDKRWKIDPSKTPFENALANMPASCIGNYDPLSHTSIADLLYCAEHEMDMFSEGQETDIKNNREYRTVQRYVEWLKNKQLP